MKTPTHHSADNPSANTYKPLQRELPSHPKEPPKGGFVHVARRFICRAVFHRALLLLISALTLSTTASSTHAQTPNPTGWSQLGALPPSTYDLALDGNTPPTLYALAPNGLSRSAD